MNAPLSMNTLILGAGPTGLGAAYRLKELGKTDFLVIDAADDVGGLSRSFVDSHGFTWDIGGHVQFSHYPYFDQVMEKALGKDGWLHHQRESWAWMENRFVPYPIQNNIRYLTPATVWKCVQGLLEAAKHSHAQSPLHFEEWIKRTFGEGLADVFMMPYNYKVWAYPPSEMNYQWIGERVSVTDVGRVLKNIILQQDDISWGPNHTFHFPKRGGTGVIWKNVAQIIGSSQLHLNDPVVRIDRKNKIVHTRSGASFIYQNLLNTIPLDQFCDLLHPGLSPAALSAKKELKFSSSNIIGIGLRGQPPEHLRTKCWMYFPEPNCPFYRVTVFSNYSPENTPEPGKYWSLMTETSESPQKLVQQDQLLEDTIQGCLHTKLISDRASIVSTWSYRAHHGYPTPFINRDLILETLRDEIESDGIFSRGRFGGWKYEVSNQDHSFMQGVEWSNRLVLNEPEVTYFYPSRVNGR